MPIHSARVTYDAGRLKPADLKKAVERAGYEVEEEGDATARASFA